MDLLKDKSFALVVISKSGTTTEPAIAFRLLKDLLESKYSEEEAKERVVAITDAKKGALRTLATQKGYKTFVIPDDVGGRFSVLTPVGRITSYNVCYTKLLRSFRIGTPFTKFVVMALSLLRVSSL